MENMMLTIDELSSYLKIKKSTLYGKVSQKEIPHYKLGHLLRFKKEEIDAWLADHKQDLMNVSKKARDILKKSKPIDIDRTINKAIEAHKGSV